MQFGPASEGRLLLALGLLAVLALLAWWTMDPGQWRTLVWVLLGFFAFRMVLLRAGSR